MINYNKSLLSLATVFALTSGLTANSYIPLTSNAKDYNWVMFGVNGFAGKGTSAGTTENFETGGSWTRLDDTVKNDVASYGWAIGVNNMGSVKIVNDSTTSVTAFRSNINLSGQAWNETEPVRSMYLDASDDGKASVLITYKSSLEGETVEYQLNSDTDTTYEFTLSHLNTYDDPAKTTGAKVITADPDGIATIAGGDNYDVVDFSLNDNPNDPNDFVFADNLTAASGTPKVRMYSYDASIKTWEIYDRANNALSNGFTTLKKGKGYWGRIDSDGDGTTDNNKTKAGLVLSNSDITAADYTAAGLTNDAWNLISFDKNKADIKIASTGMIIDISDTVSADFNITDSSSNHKIQVSADANNSVTTCQTINTAIREQKSKGNVSDTFDLLAIPGDSNTSIVLISNKKFAISDDTNTSVINTATTLTGSTLWSKTAGAVDLSATPLASANAEIWSVYGEYSLMVTPVLGGAVDLQGASTAPSASISILGNDPVPISTGGATARTAAQIATLIKAGMATAQPSPIVTNAIAVDLDSNETSDNVLMSSTTKFYIKDSTFTKVYQLKQTLASGSDVIKIKGTNTADIDPATNAVLSAFTDAVITQINAKTDGTATTKTDVYAALDTVNTTGKIVAVGAIKDINGFDLLDSYGEFLTDTTSSEDIAKGAISAVYSLGKLAKNEVYQHVYTIDFDVEYFDSAETNLTVNINGTVVDDNTTAIGITADTATGRLTMWNSLKKIYNDWFESQDIDLVAEHDYVNGTSNAAKLTITGYGALTIADTNITIVDNNETSADGNTTTNPAVLSVDTNTTNFGKVNSPSTDLASDLVFNAVYSPDYPTDGPLYTLKASGHNPQAMITGNTDMSDGSVGWDSIDFTKAPVTWATNKDFNLFTTDYKAGYWVWLEDDAGSVYSNDAIGVTDVVYNPTYTHHFNADGTVYNRLTANLTFNVTGIPTDTTPVRVYATLGKKVEFGSTSNDAAYSAQISDGLIETLQGAETDIQINISNGLGYFKNDINISKTIDLKAPSAPTVAYSADGLRIKIDNNVTDGVVAYHVYKAAVLEHTQTTDYLEKLLPAAALDYNLGASLNADFGQSYTAKVFAMDGTGDMGGGNVSPVSTMNYEQMTKESVMLVDVQSSTNIADSLGEYYDATGTLVGTETVNSGVAVESVSTLAEVKLMFGKIANVTSDVNIPNTFYIDFNADGTGDVAVMYEDEYAGDSFYIVFGGKTYKAVFQPIGTQGTSSTDLLTTFTEITTGQTF